MYNILDNWFSASTNLPQLDFHMYHKYSYATASKEKRNSTNVPVKCPVCKAAAAAVLQAFFSWDATSPDT